MSNKRLLNTVPVQSKILLLVAVATIGLILLWGANFIGTQLNVPYQEEVERTTHLQKVVSKIEIGFLQERRNEKNFLIRQDEKYIAKHVEAKKEIAKYFTEAEKYGHKDENEQISLIRTAFHDYSEEFDKISTMWREIGLTPNVGLRGDLRQAAQDVESLVEEYDAKEVVVAMLMLRRAEKNFLIRASEKYRDDFSQALEKFSSIADKSSISGASKAKIEEFVLAYENSFNQMVDVRLAAEEEVKKLNEIFSKAEPILLNLFDVVDIKNEAAIEAQHEIQSSAQIIGGVLAGVIFIISLGLSLIIGRTISIPVIQLSDEMKRISNDEVVDVAKREGRDEIADMGNTLFDFQRKLQEANQLREEAAKQQEIQLERGRKVNSLSSDFDDKITHVLEIVSAASTELDASAKTMSSIASGSSDRAASAATASDEATANVQTVASACEELSASIQEISRQSVQSNELAQLATKDVEATENVVQELSESAKRISEVVSIISDIAEQTNLLALNATIEAARAGEAGKGFAVVANEVKSLATQTGRATTEISETIHIVLGKVSESVDAISNVTGRISEIAQMISGISAAVEEQNAATSEISRNVEEAANGTTDVNKNVGEVSRLAEEAGAASGEVQTASEELAQQSNEMKKVVDSFLDGVRAA